MKNKSGPESSFRRIKYLKRQVFDPFGSDEVIKTRKQVGQIEQERNSVRKKLTAFAVFVNTQKNVPY